MTVNSYKWIAIFVTIVLALSLYFNFKETNSPFDCAEMGVEYLNYARAKYKITDFGSKTWEKIIDIETELVNLCYVSPESTK